MASLYDFACKGNLDEIKTLISQGRDINEKGWNGNTALHGAAMKANMPIVQFLINECPNVDVHATNNNSNIALHCAADKGASAVMQCLIKQSSDVNAKNALGWTPLHNASIYGHVKAMEILVAEGHADVQAKDNEGKTPLDWAKDGQQQHAVEFLQSCTRINGLSSTNFVHIYDGIDAATIDYNKALYAADELITVYGKMFGVSAVECNDFYMSLRHEAIKQHSHAGIMLENMELLCTRMWTSALTLRVGDQQREFCSILQHALRTDDETLLKPACVLIRAINQMCVTRRKPGDIPVPWPSDYTLYRGGSLPREHFESFFKNVGTIFRFKTFFATSVEQKTAIQFMQRSAQPRVLWVVKIDPVYTCMNVNFVDGVVKLSTVPTEKEFLFAPYSVFTIATASFNDDAGHYVIELKAAVDNNQKNADGKPRFDDAALAPWS